MTQMRRKQIVIPKRQQVQLKRLAKARCVSEAEVIRQAIDLKMLLAASQTTAGDRSALEDCLRFGAARRAAGDSTGRAWTRDELYDERLSRYQRADS